MVGQNKEIIKLENLEEYKNWISEQNWYQTIHLKKAIFFLELSLHPLL